MDKLESLLLLNAARSIPPARARKLITHFGDASAFFGAPMAAWSASGLLTPVMTAQLEKLRRSFDPQEEIRQAQQHDIEILTFDDVSYPANLKEIFDPPVILYVKGDLLPADSNAVGVVGSRNASTYGLSCAQEFAGALAGFGLTVVSGLARGVDTAAHRAALDAGGRTLAILGSGLLDIYPPENEKLYRLISEKGAVISEFPLTTPPLPANFPVRNRVISGLSRGVLVVEASARSGALITARLALEQNREVFSIPGKLSSSTSLGTNELIKQGARLVTGPSEILEDLRPILTLPARTKTWPAPSSDAPRGSLSPQEAMVVAHLTDEPTHIDQLCAATGMGPGPLCSVLTGLELKGAVRQLPGKQFVAP